MAIEPGDLLSHTNTDSAELDEFYRRYGFRKPREAGRHLREIAECATTETLLEPGLEGLLDTLSRAADPDLALNNLERYVAVSESPAVVIESLMSDQALCEVVTCVLGGSSFLARVFVRHPEYVELFYGDNLKATKQRREFISHARAAINPLRGDRARLEALHHFQNRELLRIGARDLLGTASVEDVTKELSWLADAIIQVVFEEASLHVPEAAEGDLEFAVIGVGKLGGEELNFSSDIDIFYIYSDGIHADAATKLARRVNRYLTDPSVSNVFYRVDLRLRPEGSRGPMASSMESLATYYERWGETFERLALSKARCVAGSAALGDAFLDLIEPFVYRRYLDYAAIDEVGDMKREIDRQVESSGELTRNVKLGRGGIREIEFFVQALQVLYGGEATDLRVRSTLQALERLRSHGLVEEDVVGSLHDAYLFLRNVEHKLQIVEQRQTHTLPEDEDEFDRCGRRMRLSPSEFRSRLQFHRRAVREVFDLLFQSQARTEEATANSVHRFFSGAMDKDESVRWLLSCGFDDGRQAYEILVSLRDAPSFGHSPRKMRNLLTNVITHLLDTLGESVNPGRVLTGFERLTSAIGAREAFFTSLLGAQGSVRRLARVLALSEPLRETLIRRPGTVEFLIDEERMSRRIQSPFETDSRKMFEFYVAVQYLFGGLTRCRASRLMSAFADAKLQGLLASDGQLALYALGKFGERELNYRSDLDVVAFYHGNYKDASAALEGLTATLGEEFKIDLRLRPEGRKGSLVWNAEATETYFRNRGQVWERMAWTKGRFVAGNRAVEAVIRPLIDEFVYGREFDRTCVSEMKRIRMRMETELAKEGDQSWDLKLGRGGLVDVEFLAEFLQIRENIRIPNTALALRRGRAAAELIDDYYFLREVESAVRIASSLSTSRFDLDEIPVLQGILGVEDFSGKYGQVTERVRQVFEAY